MDDHFSLMAMMTNPFHKYSSDFETKSALYPGRDILNPSIWQLLFENLYGSNIFPRTKCLEDMYYRVATSQNCAMSLISIPRWQALILPIALDLPKTVENESIKKLTKYVIGVQTQLLWTTLETKAIADFARELRLATSLILAVCSELSGNVRAN